MTRLITPGRKKLAPRILRTEGRVRKLEVNRPLGAGSLPVGIIELLGSAGATVPAGTSTTFPLTIVGAGFAAGGVYFGCVFSSEVSPAGGGGPLSQAPTFKVVWQLLVDGGAQVAGMYAQPSVSGTSMEATLGVYNAGIAIDGGSVATWEVTNNEAFDISIEYFIAGVSRVA